MPLTITEVLETLEDPVALGIDFYADKIHVSAENLSRVHERIIVGDILVTGGTSDLAFYDSPTDILITQQKAPPADDGDRALLLHECVHAMVDITDPTGTITRHMGELAAYLTQTAYSVRKYPTANRTGTAPWDHFWGDLYATVRTNKLDTAKGNGAKIPDATLENLRQQLAALPSVNYGNFSKDAKDVSDGLMRHYSILNSGDGASMRSSYSAHETYPDPSDDYFIDMLNENYSAADVKGYAGRFLRLRRDFLHCSKLRAFTLQNRLSVRTRGDRLSELFHDRLSHGGRALLLRVLGLKAV
jgi:hypothetical protein